MNWLPMETAPKDGSLVLLKIQPDPEWFDITEDDDFGKTIGHNSYANTGVDEWQFAGWNWDQDCYTDGHGTPVGWMPASPEDMKPYANQVRVETITALRDAFLEGGPPNLNPHAVRTHEAMINILNNVLDKQIGKQKEVPDG